MQASRTYGREGPAGKPFSILKLAVIFNIDSPVFVFATLPGPRDLLIVLHTKSVEAPYLTKQLES